MNSDAELISRAEADALLQMPEGFLEGLARHKKGPAYFRFSRKVVRYARSELLAWRDACVIKPKTST